jgi:MraZ protein
VFRGINAIQLDEKGRLAMPARYREILNTKAKNQIIATIDTESKCLLLYPLPDWEIIEQKIESLPSFNRAARRIQRLLIGHATEMELDGSGRILLPQLLRDYAGLKKSVVLLGQGKKFELWDETEWQQARQGWLEEGLDLGGLVPSELEYLSL